MLNMHSRYVSQASYKQQIELRVRVCGNGTLGEKMSISKQINSVRRKGYSLMNDEHFTL